MLNEYHQIRHALFILSGASHIFVNLCSAYFFYRCQYSLETKYQLNNFDGKVSMLKICLYIRLSGAIDLAILRVEIKS
jgi:hypothetical protein